jgi:hypothetical protein
LGKLVRKAGGAIILGSGISLIPKTIALKVGKAFVKRPIKSTAKALGGITAGTVLVKSPKARKAVRKLPSQAVRGGEIIAAQIEGKGKGIGIGKAILAGGLAAGGVVAAAKILPAVKKLIKGKPKAPSALTENIISQVPTAVTPQLEPVGVAEQPKEPTEAVPAPVMPQINNRITVRPEINVKVSRRKQTFINQQVLQ